MGRADGTICRKVAKKAVRNAGEYDMQTRLTSEGNSQIMQGKDWTIIPSQTAS
jgi:hypothetical protein